MNAEPLIEARGVVNRFGNHVVHEGVDLDVYRGEILGVVGGSGSGKSVLLRTLLGLHRPDAGTVRLGGEPVRSRGAHLDARLARRVGVLFQHGALYSSLTVLDNVALTLVEHAGLARGDAERLARLKLALTGLPAAVADKLPAQLSGGMIKRAALARALALDPEILFLDEPTAGLDPVAAAGFDQLLLTLRDALGLTVFLVTHDLDTLYAVCDRVAVLSERRVRVSGPVEEVAGAPDAWIRDYFHGPRGRAARAAGGG